MVCDRRVPHPVERSCLTWISAVLDLHSLAEMTPSQ
jgi:hypothetical protein